MRPGISIKALSIFLKGLRWLYPMCTLNDSSGAQGIEDFPDWFMAAVMLPRISLKLLLANMFGTSIEKEVETASSTTSFMLIRVNGVTLSELSW